MTSLKQQYAEKLKDPRWQQRRLQILTRDDWTCKKCGNADSVLHVHHRYYVYGKDPWDYEDDALVSLCESCHEYEEEWKKEDLALIMRTIQELLWRSDWVELAQAIRAIRANTSEDDMEIIWRALSHSAFRDPRFSARIIENYTNYTQQTRSIGDAAAGFIADLELVTSTPK